MSSVFFSETIFSGSHDAFQVKSALQNFSSLASKLHEDEVVTQMPADPYSLRVGTDRQLWQILYSSADECVVNIEEITGVSRILERAPTYDASVDESLHAVADDGATTRFALYSPIFAAERSILAGAVGAPGRESGEYKIAHADGRSRDFYAVEHTLDLLALYRHHILANRCDHSVFTEYSGRAFPNLMILDGVSPDHLGVDLSAHAATVVRHLSYLNDKCLDDCAQCGWDMPKVQQRASTNRVNFSDESSQTKGDKRKMRLREVRCTIQGETRDISCGLHTKIESTRGRIHFSIETVKAGRFESPRVP